MSSPSAKPPDLAFSSSLENMLLSKVLFRANSLLTSKKDEMLTLSGASARPSELVNCSSSLSPRAWLPGMQAGVQAANASSSRNPSANLDPPWSRQQAGASCSASQPPRTANSTAAPILLGSRQAGESVTSSPLSRGSHRIPPPS